MHLPYTHRLGRIVPALSLGAAALLAADPAFAQITISGALSDTTTGPLTAGVYLTSSSLSVPAGQTLTIQPGVIIKFGFNHDFSVAGRLLVNGTGPNSVIFTESRDDSAGGDTNGDGNASSPTPGYWNSFRLLSTSDACVVQGLTVRYSGRGSRSLLLASSSASLTDCTVVDSSTASFDLDNSSRPTLVRCSSVRSGGDAFARVPLAAIPGFSGLGASGGPRDFIDISSPTLAPGESVTIGPGNLIDGTVVLSGSLTIPQTATLRALPGTVMKWSFASRCNVDGVLRIEGTAASPVVFTEVRDDSVGGDTNGDGLATLPDAGYWGGVLLRDTADASSLSHAEIRYAGRNGSGLELVSSTASISSCALTDSAGFGLDLNANSLPSVDGLTVTGAGNSAVGAASVQALAGLAGLNLTGNAFDRIDVTSATVTAGESVAFGPENGAGGAFHFTTSVIVEPGAQLTISPGAICKMGFATRCQIDGILNSNASAAMPVVFTELRDDSVGGDTNGDGDVTDPAPGYWAGLVFSSTADGSQLANVAVRYAGRNGAGIKVSNATMSMERCRVLDCSGFGIDLDESTEPCLLDRPQIDRCSGFSAIGHVRLDRIEDILRPSGEGNTRNTIEISGGTLAADTSVEIEHLWDGTAIVTENVRVPDGVALTLGPNVVLKMGFATAMEVDGALSVRGSFERAAILTELRDDSAGGDTNGDAGASVPSRGYWTGLTLRSNSATSIVQGLEVRFAGRAGVAVNSSTNRAILREVRVTESGGDGFRISDHPIALQRLVVAGSSGDGVELLSGGFDVRQVTLLGPGGFGVRALPAYSGSVKDSIIRGYATGASTGLLPARLTYSNVDSSPGTGSITGDPLFVDEANGDYRLTSNSPCINAGDPASSLDPDSTRADMGAYFRNACEPSVICTQSLVFPPCTPVMGYEGFASVSSPQPFLVTLDDAPTSSFGSFFYSMGAQTTITALYGDLCVGGPFQRTPPVASGGTPSSGPCAGHFALDFNAFLQSGADPALTPGSSLIGHFWYRYGAAPGNARFSDGIRIVICP